MTFSTANPYLLILIIIAKFYSVNLPGMHFTQDFIHLVQPPLVFWKACNRMKNERKGVLDATVGDPTVMVGTPAMITRRTKHNKGRRPPSIIRKGIQE